MKNKVFESFYICCLLAAVGGFLDIYTYLLKGHVFANAQTGNIVLMAYGIATKDFSSVSMYAMPILAFAMGVMVSELIRNHVSYQRRMTFHHVIIIVELIVLAALMNWDLPHNLFNAIVGFICSMQVSTFTHVAGLPFASTMCTGNLKSMSLQFYMGIFTSNRASLKNGFIYLGIIISFIIGAVIATFLIEIMAETALIFPITILALVLVIQLKQYYVPDY